MSQPATTKTIPITSQEFWLALLRGIQDNKLSLEAGLIFLSVISGLAVLVQFPAPLRALLVCAFLLVCPGLALVRLLNLRDLVSEFSIGIALSLALDTLVGSVMVYTRSWSPALGMVVLIAIALAASGWKIYLTLRK